MSLNYCSFYSKVLDWQLFTVNSTDFFTDPQCVMVTLVSSVCPPKRIDCWPSLHLCLRIDVSFSRLSLRATKLWTFTLKRSVNGFKTPVLIYSMLMSLNSLLNLEAFLSQSAWNEEVSRPLRRFDLIAAQLTSGEHTLCCQLKNKLHKKHSVEDEFLHCPWGPGSLVQVLIHLKIKCFCRKFTLLQLIWPHCCAGLSVKLCF